MAEESVFELELMLYYYIFRKFYESGWKIYKHFNAALIRIRNDNNCTHLIVL